LFPDDFYFLKMLEVFIIGSGFQLLTKKKQGSLIPPPMFIYDISLAEIITVSLFESAKIYWFLTFH